MIVNFKRTFSAAHRIPGDSGKCWNIHGHNYEVDISILSTSLTEQGFIIPFDRVKDIVDAFDHVLILAEWDPIGGAIPTEIYRVPFSPSTENMARYICDLIVAEFDECEVTVNLRETASISAVAKHVKIK